MHSWPSNFSVGKTNALRGRISSFQQQKDESIPEAWESLQKYIATCPHHDMEQWLVIQNFFHGLTPRSQEHLGAAAGGAFISLDVARANALVDKVASHQSWKGERQLARTRSPPDWLYWYAGSQDGPSDEEDGISEHEEHGASGDVGQQEEGNGDTRY